MKKDDEEDGLQEKEEAKVEGRSPKRARVEAKEVADIPSTSEATERASASESTPSFGFGGGFAGFAALKSSGSGFGSTASIASGAGGFAAFAAAAASSQGDDGFKLKKTENEITFGAAFGTSSAFGGTPFDPTNAVDDSEEVQSSLLPMEEAPANGEENETCLGRFRAKLFELVKPSDAKQIESTTKANTNENTTVTTNETISQVDKVPSWSERGIGQLRVLESIDKTAMRIVMRREQTHSLLLNVKLAPKLVTVAKHLDTAIRLVCVTTADSAATHLLRVKTRSDRDVSFFFFFCSSFTIVGPF
uniref:RanBD1 domain-containing protein n=3 Tax=Aureoumbra lagunensis TaxID=44058 RepID=A0A7S3JTA0_9STRA|mmetsp:Transcript_16139/g.24241  ORF Transcript_16139/g.24241 Transcript_16139/m.24241 type:complete len:305 (-) Transcript_16139:267-1181(-)